MLQTLLGCFTWYKGTSVDLFDSLSHLHVCSDGGVRHAVLARVVINDSLFVLCAVSLAVCIFKIAKMSSANVYLESKVCKRRVVARVRASDAWPFWLPPPAGYVCVPGHRHRSCGDSALHVQGLLQPGGGVPFATRQTQSLQLRLVQRFWSGRATGVRRVND